MTVPLLNPNKCEKCQRVLNDAEELTKHSQLHDKDGDICIMCGLGLMVANEDDTRISCTECSTTWVKKGHEKPVSDRI